MWRALIGLSCLIAAGCGSEGSVTFAIVEPSDPDLNPVSARVSEYLVRSAAGDLIGVASVSTVGGGGGLSTQRLALGALGVTSVPEDVEVDLLSGSALVGMARVRDVLIKAGIAATYVAEVRKPLVFVGSALPDEQNAMNMLLPGEILDPTTSADLANPKSPPGPTQPPPPKLPADASSTAVTSDGRFALAGRKNALTVLDTGSGKLVGDAPLPFVPTRLVVAPRDAAVLAVGNDGSNGLLALFADVAQLTGSPTTSTPRLMTLMNLVPRTATFSTDGRRLFVLTGGPSADPCAPDATLAPNALLAIGLDAAVLTTWTLPGFVDDIALDPQSGQLVLSEAKQVSIFDPSTPAGPAVPRRLFAATCPSALHVGHGEVFAVSSDLDPSFDNSFDLYRAPLSGGAPQVLPFGAPVYEAPTDMPSKDGNVRFNIELRPASIMAYDIAVTPDSNRALFATRARYHEAREPLQLLGIDCMATVDIVEYGLYSLDTQTGNASYDLRAQLVTVPTGQGACIVCPTSVGDLTFFCPSLPGDRAAGVAAIFGEP